jgi:UPF0042 nucleotide-binding protein
VTDACEPLDLEDETAGTPAELVVITGMSGAGRSEAMHTFEDLGYFCIDNLPPAFIPQLTELAELPGSRIRKLAVVCDVRGQAFFEQLAGELDKLHERGVAHRVLFLEADRTTLLNRFKETRRRHPLCEEGLSLSEGIETERVALSPIRARADVVLDSSESRPMELRKRIREEFIAGPLTHTLSVSVTSFGFKYGAPSDADIVMDVRFLPNPYYNPDLRPLTGLEAPVRQFVLGRTETADFLKRWLALLDSVTPGYLAEGKTHLVIALGCTGGQHRSVALAEATAAHLRKGGYRVAVSHRDIERDRESR